MMVEVLLSSVFALFFSFSMLCLAEQALVGKLETFLV
jgi:hypothetical protein